MDILIGTTNPMKLARFRRLLGGDEAVNLLSLADLGITEEPPETGSDSAENAVIKARFYSRFADCVVCGDAGLYLEGLALDDPRQPGLHVRSPQGKRLDDDEMLDYYTDLVRSLGGRVRAVYLDGVAVMNHGQLSTFMEDFGAVAEQSAFWMVDTPTEARHVGWPLDSISIDRNTGCYFTDDDARAQQLNEQDPVFQGGYLSRLSRFLRSALALD